MDLFSTICYAWAELLTSIPISGCNTMSVSWSDNRPNGDKNRFANKHLHVVKRVTDMDTMIGEGQQVLRDRRKNVKETVEPLGGGQEVLKMEQYGKIRPTANTLVVTNLAGLSMLESWIESNANAAGHYKIEVKVGAIIQATVGPDGTIVEDRDMVTTCGAVTVSIDVEGAKKIVYHLEKADLTGGILRDFKISSGGVAFVA